MNIITINIEQILYWTYCFPSFMNCHQSKAVCCRCSPPGFCCRIWPGIEEGISLLLKHNTPSISSIFLLRAILYLLMSWWKNQFKSHFRMKEISLRFWFPSLHLQPQCNSFSTAEFKIWSLGEIRGWCGDFLLSYFFNTLKV